MNARRAVVILLIGAAAGGVWAMVRARQHRPAPTVSRPPASTTQPIRNGESPTLGRQYPAPGLPSEPTPNRLGAWLFSQRAERHEAVDFATTQRVMRVPVSVIGPPELPLSVHFSLTGGIPFPMGQLQPGQPVRLHDTAGSIWPVQAKPAATWEDGSVKWLQLTTAVPTNGQGRQLSLEYGPSVAADLPGPTSVRVDDGADAVTVTTGPITFTVSKRRFAMFDAVFADSNRSGSFEDRERLSSGGDLVVTHDNREFRSSLDTRTYQLVVEESGPLRATLKATGWLRDAKGEGFCQFIVRIQAYAGLPELRIFHTLVYTGFPGNRAVPVAAGARLPDNETIQSIAIELPVNTSQSSEFITADDRGVITTPLSAAATITQASHQSSRLREGDKTLREAVRTEGWALVQDASGGVLAEVRDAWQQFPKQLIADPVAHRMVMKLWPESAGELDLQTQQQAAGADGAGTGRAFGLAKTHELMLGFIGVHVEPELAQSIAALWREPWVLAADPDWIYDTDALGTLAPQDRGRFSDAETMLQGLFDWAERQPRNFAWYGMLDAGDTRTWYRKEAPEKSYEDWGWHPEGRWGWHNGDGVGQEAAALLAFARSQDIRYLRYGQALARHIMDVDTVHYDTVANDPRLRRLPPDASRVGSMHRANADHWGGPNDDASSTNVAGLLLDYYLTGEVRAWDVAQEVGGFLLGDPLVGTTRSNVTSPRTIGNILLGDVLLYQATWDPRCRDAASRWVRTLIDGQQPDGTWLEAYDPSARRWSGDAKNSDVAEHVLPALIAYHRLTGDTKAAAAITKAADALLVREPQLTSLDAIAYTYLLTGDHRYLEQGQRCVQALVAAQLHVDDPTRDGMVFDQPTYDRVGPILATVPLLFGAIDSPDFATLARTLPPAPAARPSAAAPAEPAQPLPYSVLVASSLEKFLPEIGVPASAHANSAMIDLARNEFESVQMIVRDAGQGLTSVTIDTHPLRQRGGAATIPAESLQWSSEGFVRTEQPDYPVSHVGLWPDPLPGALAFDVPAGQTRAVWLTLHTDATTPPGDYDGRVTVHPSNAPPHDVELVVKVRNFTLPATPSLKTAFDVYSNRIKSAYETFFPEWWRHWPSGEQAVAELRERLYDDLIRHRLAPILNVDPSQAGALDWLRAHPTISAFAVGPRGGSFDNEWPTEPRALAALEPAYRGYATALRQAGLLDRHYIYTYDEPAPGQPAVADVARMIHRADPSLKNLVTLGVAPDIAKLRDWFAPIDIVCFRNVIFDPEQAKQLQAMGKEVWLYVSGPKPPYPTLVIDYPAMAYRVLPWMCWKYGATGLLYWSVNYWTTDPYKQPMNTKWRQNGNGSLYYPGPRAPVPSLRVEVLRDGIEDYDYFVLLRRAVDEACRRGGDADPARATLIQQAEALLRIDPAIVSSMRDYTTDPQPLIATRTRMADLIEQLQSGQ